MKSLYICIRLRAVTKHLRLLAAGIDAATGPDTLREASKALTDLQTLILMALYQWDSEIVQNAKYGYDRTETK